MKKLIVEKIDDKTIRIEDLSRQTSQVYSAEFRAQGNERKKIIKIHNGNESVVYLAHYAEIEVNGRSTWSNVQEVVSELNTFLGNFKGGGSASGGNAQTDWVRPADRPAVPSFIQGEQTAYLLFGVRNQGLNEYAFRTTDSSGYYTVDWGDGTIEMVANSETAEHSFDFNAIDSPVGIEGYKWVWIKVTTPGGTVTQFYPGTYKPSWNPTSRFIPQVFELYIQLPELTTLNLGNNAAAISMVQIIEIEKTKISSGFILSGFNSLKAIKIETGSFTTSLLNMLENAHSFNQAIDLDAINATNASSFLRTCSSYNKPVRLRKSENIINMNSFLQGSYSFNSKIEIDTVNVNTFQSFLQDCRSFNQEINIDTSNATNLWSFLNGCWCFNQKLNIDTGNVTNFQSFLQNCINFNQELNIDTSKGKTFTGFLNNCNRFNRSVTVDLASAEVPIGENFIGNANYMQTGLRLLNMGLIHNLLDVRNSAMTADAIMLLCEDLPDRSSTTAGTLRLAGTPASVQLSSTQIDEFTAKNWTLILG